MATLKSLTLMFLNSFFQGYRKRLIPTVSSMLNALWRQRKLEDFTDLSEFSAIS